MGNHGGTGAGINRSILYFFIGSGAMVEKYEDKPNGPVKSFMTVGPTLHYSHANVHRCWGLAVTVYVLTCFFWLKLLTGVTLSPEFIGAVDYSRLGLGKFTLTPLSIYEYPWMILVMGLMMGILGTAPVLASQLMSFRYSIPMILSVMFIAKLPLFGAFLILSCVAAACRPLRFRSRFIAIALCMAPQIVYWAVWGGNASVDPIRLGFSFAPWICAWLTGLSMAGIVIGVGHFTRYRPGLIWTVSGLILGLSLYTFQHRISFGELDYQLYVAGNNPELVSEFYDRDMSSAIDEAMTDPSTKSYLAGLFYPTEPSLLRQELKNEMAIELGYDRWPNWFKGSKELNYPRKRQWLNGQYDLFISKRSTSNRMPIGLYYKAMLHEYRPDILRFMRTEVLHFYNDYPHKETLPIWYALFDKFGQSPESIEARWRIGMHLSGQGKFEKTREMCEVAEVMIDNLLSEEQTHKPSSNGLLTAFVSPAQTIMTPLKLNELRIRFGRLQELIGEENLTENEESRKHLARFVILNPHWRDYEEKLDDLLSETGSKGPLLDNILLKKAMLIDDMEERGKKLKELSDQFVNTDGGKDALYELGMVKVSLWKDPGKADLAKTQCLGEARAILTSFMAMYPESLQSEQARNILNSLPVAE